MSSIIPFQTTLGLAFSITGLTLVAPVSYHFRSYSHTLDAAQLFYVFATVFAPSINLFSNELKVSWLSFMPNFLNYCINGDYSCNYGNLISPTLCWIGSVFLLLIIFKLVAIKKPNLKFQPFYTFYKGFLRWTLGPLVYYSTTTLITALK